MPSFALNALPAALAGHFLLAGETRAFLPPRTLSSTSRAPLGTATDSAVIGTNEDTSGGRTVNLDDDKYAFLGSTQLKPQPRNLEESPKLLDAYLTGKHPDIPQEELGRGEFIMSDWRKAWHTYGSCDLSITPQECNKLKSEDGLVVDPFTGEAEYEIDDIEGELPDDLVGVLYRIGPGKMGVNGERVAHVLDADGLVLRFEFTPPEEMDETKASSRVKFTSRFVETEGFIEENEAKQFTKRGTFGTAPRGPVKSARKGLNENPDEKAPLISRMVANAGNVDIKNAANTQVIAFGGKVLALWEAGLPHSLDPVTLETIGIDNLGLPGVSADAGKLAVNYIPGLPEEFQPDYLGGKAHTAHPKMCPKTGHLVGWTWAQNPASGSVEVTFTEYESDNFTILGSATYNLEGVALTPHDMVLTEHYIVLKINALEMDQMAFLTGAKGPAESLGMDGRAPVKAFVFPRPTLSEEKKKEFEPFVVEDIPACFSIHFSHGYEDEKTGNIVSYFSGWPPSDSDSFLGAWGGFCPDYIFIPETFYWRMEIDPTIKKVIDLRVSPGAENVCCEHPVVHPNFVTRDATFSYAQCCNAIGDASAPMGLAKFRLDGGAKAQPNLKPGDMNDQTDVFWLSPRQFSGEPLVVPKRGGDSENEKEAYLLGLVYDSVKDRSSIMVFDLEKDLKEGPVAQLWLKTALPHGLHGCFSPDASVQTSSFC